MARIELEVPEKFMFATEISVRISDINYGNHLGNDAVLALLHEARLQFFKRYGFKESDIGGPGIIMVDSVITYLSQAFHGDVLVIEITVSDLDKYGFDLFYRMTNVKTGKEVVRAKTGMLCFDYTKNRVVSVPETFKDIISNCIPTP
ncbi:MAG: thioesterase family protein [Syntrophales bacterium]|jgi:acyl-CoA thioesterase FadM|nr:thioesterase family protein [Syntrophales bacterium]